jgi:Zn-finger nucleic acid-binding protein
MTVLPMPACPTCRAPLTLESDHTFDAWVCPAGHGLGFTLSEAYERLADDQIHEIWRSANATDVAASTRGCPMCERTMVAVACENLTLDVCTVDEVLWLDAGELEQLPPDVPDPEPSALEQAELAQVTEQFGDALTQGWADEADATLTGRLTARFHRSRTTSTSS